MIDTCWQNVPFVFILLWSLSAGGILGIVYGLKLTLRLEQRILSLEEKLLKIEQKIEKEEEKELKELKQIEKLEKEIKEKEEEKN
ncbi:MAG: hypothetical protein ABGW69_03045 [Nanoarchaeota archaeon]